MNHLEQKSETRRQRTAVKVQREGQKIGLDNHVKASIEQNLPTGRQDDGRGQVADRNESPRAGQDQG